MRFISTPLIISTLIFGSSSYAQKKSDPSELSKESYLPLNQELALLGRVSFGSTKTSLNGPAGNVLDSKTSNTSLQYRLGYGFSDTFSLGIQGKYLFSEKRDISYGAGSTLNGTSETLKKSGVEEPVLAAAIRVYDNEASKARVHISGEVSPKLQTAKYATTTSDGNAGTGGNQYRFSVNVYKEVNTTEISFGLSRALIDLRKLEDPSDSQKLTEYAEHQNTEITIGAMKALTDSFSFGGNFGLHFGEGYKVTGYTGNQITSSIDYDSISASVINLTAKYKLAESSILIFDVTTLLNFSQSASSGMTKLNVGTASSTETRIGWLQSF